VDSRYFEEGNVKLDAKHECKDSKAFQVITYLHVHQHLLCHYYHYHYHCHWTYFHESAIM